MNFSSEHKITKLNLDKAYKSLDPDESFYMLNHETANPSSLGKAVPMAANYAACDMELPAGENYNTGRYYSPLTNETYSWTLNSNGVNFISRINGDGICEVVYSHECLTLSADPAHEITAWRAYMWVEKVCHNRHGKQLIWVDGTETPIGQLDVEASIATNFFTTPFFEKCTDNPCVFIQMCVPEPDGCLKAEFIPYSITEQGLTNRIIDKGLKFMYRYVYYDLRASEWSDRSSLYWQDSKGCFDNSEGFSRCMKFEIPIGNPMVDKIEFAVSEDGGLSWYLYDTIEKYNPYTSSEQKWYERDLMPSVNQDTCTIEYIFCNDKERTAIDPLAVSREFNPMPREPQGLIPMKESLAFYNYKKGNCPIDQNQVEKFRIEKVCPDAENSCNEELVEVKVRAVIYNDYFERNGFIFRTGGASGATADDPTDPAWFGTINPVFTGGLLVKDLATGYDQTFSGKTRNFIAYIEGTERWVEMKQWKAKPGFTSTVQVGVLSGMVSQGELVKKNLEIKNGGYYYQEAIFKVPKGMKGFIRLVSHHQTTGTGDNQNTSTQVIGTLGDIRNYTGTSFLAPDNNNKEIYFDTCAPDFDKFEAFVIQDVFSPDVPAGLSPHKPQSAAHSGYVTDGNSLPVEGARMYQGSTYKTTTDFNGFYSFSETTSDTGIKVYVERNCSEAFTFIEQFVSGSDIGQMSDVDYQIQSDNFKNNFYLDVNVPVNDCDGHGVAGVKVAMRGSKAKSTGADGVARFKLRNYNSRGREVSAVIMDRGGCFSIDCSGVCNPCMPSSALTLLPSCFQFDRTPQVRTLSVGRISTQNLSGRIGLKHGGNYGFGIIAEGDCGRLSAVNKVTYIDIPRVQQSNTLNFCRFTYNGGGIQLPLWVKRVKIVRTANLNPFDLQWLVDKVERTSDGKIKLTIQSLNDYNASFNFKTNTVYKYNAGDRVEFIRNGDGTVFPIGGGVLNFLTLSPFNDESVVKIADDPNYFNQLIIFDEGKLDNLKEGALIEIQTPHATIAEPAYFEICATIDVVNGQLQIPSGTFTTFDTYLVNRQAGKFPARLFESKSPSDFWGITSVDNTLSFLDDTGKVHFINKYENERRWGRNITKNSPTQFNYFGDFEKTFDAKEQGDIVALSLKDDKIGLGISENDNFLFEVSDQLLRVGADNVIHAATADAFISNPQAKLRGKYGCSYDDIGSIFFGDGFVTYIDVTANAYIVHDYQIAKEAGEEITTRKPIGEDVSQCSSFFRKRITDKSRANKTAATLFDHYRYSTGLNKSTGSLYLTLKTLRQPGINNEKAVYVASNDTIVYNPSSDIFTGFASFTPEGYSELSLNNETGCAFITFQNSLPYIHPIVADRWNVFYDVPCDWVVAITINGQPKLQNKIKIPLAIELQSETMFYVSRVTTEMSQLRSEIPAVRFKKTENKWNAAFLKDAASRGGLYNGAAIRSYATNVVFVRDNTINLAYGSIDNSKREKYSELDSILIKFMVSESAGMTENL